MQLPPIIAIYGVGNHEPGDVEAMLRGAFERAQLTADISELDWDKFARIRDGIWLLDHTAQSISETARLPLLPTGGKADRLLHQVEELVYQRVFRLLVAIALCVLIAGPLLWLLVLVSSAAFRSITVEDFGWAFRAANTVMVAGAGVVLILVFVALLRSVVTRTLRPMWVVVRRVALLLMQPLILLQTVPFAWRLGSPAVSLVAKFIPLAVVSAVLSLALSPLTGYDHRQLASEHGISFLTIVTISLLGALHLIFRQLWVGGPLKVILDIVRYLGDPPYRARLQTELDQRLQALPVTPAGSRSVVLYAHSLGSVIALDSLCNSAAWQATDDVLLVTLGSPIKRCFIRLFPRYLFPPSVRAAARTVASRLGTFRWINLHRRWDYVGTSLGLDRGGVGVDLCTGQGRRVLTSHSNYWADDVVVEKLLSGLETVRPAQGMAPQPTASSAVIPTVRTTRMQIGTAKGLRAAATAVLAITFAVAVVKFLSSRSTWIERVDAAALTVQQSGVQTLADVTYHRTLEGSGEDSYYLHHFAIHLPPPLGDQKPIEIAHNVIYSEDARRFDYKALARHVAESCKPAAIKPRWQVLKSKLSIPCTRTGISVRYDVRRPDRVYFPQFPGRRTFWTGAAEGFGSVAFGLFIAMGCAVVVFYCGIPLFLWFLGLNASAARPSYAERVELDAS